MRILLISLLVASGLYADNNATLNIVSGSNTTLPVGTNQTMDSKNNNATLPNRTTSALPDIANMQDNKPINPDERLKNDIITFNRFEYISKDKNANIIDPFVYVYPKTEDDLAFVAKVEQAMLVLKGIFNSGNVYKANINNKWLEEGGKVEGWEISKIEKNKVELKFRDKKKVLNTFSSKVKITKEYQ